MIEDLKLTSREADMLRSALGLDASETVSQFVRRKGMRGVLWLVIVLLSAIGGAIIVGSWPESLRGNGMAILMFLVIAVGQMLRQRATDGLICKLYRALEVRGGPASEPVK